MAAITDGPGGGFRDESVRAHLAGPGHRLAIRVSRQKNHRNGDKGFIFHKKDRRQTTPFSASPFRTSHRR